MIHEEDFPAIRAALDHYSPDPEVLGLVLQVLHFKRDYWSINPWMYRNATRIIRNHCGTRSTTDGCDFRAVEHEQMIKSGEKGRLVKARVFHCGWVKNPQILQRKLAYQHSSHDGEVLRLKEIERRTTLLAQFPNCDILKSFRGTHPQVMETRVRGMESLRTGRIRWLNRRFYRENLRHGFKG